MKLSMASSILSALAFSAPRAYSFAFVRKVPTRRIPGALRLASTAVNSPPATNAAQDIAGDDEDTSIYTQEAEALSKLESSFLQTMRDRGFLHQCTGIADLDEKMSSGCISAYLGFDATAQSVAMAVLY